MLKILFHLVGAIQFFYGCYYDYNYVIVPPSPKSPSTFGGKFKYLTYLNAMLQTLYFTIALLNDLIGSEDVTPSEKPLIRRIKDAIFSALAFPISLFVGITFWGIYAVDRELILPKMLDAVFPAWLNHVMHTNILLFTFVELASSFRMYPPRKRGLSILTTFMLAYVVWVHVIYFKSGTWVYPILAVLSWPLRIIFYIFSLMLVFGFYTLGETLNKSIWTKEVEITVKSEKKKAK
ncbi:androgen-induced gene 1 protein-like [Aricia agestis]|uniref:androgen-induced gene 1 protein-like n=1 Tax=Aricia agestis TaxID=91739 RepID=UPI001C208903|nr:androgen-induced gene 1 protein-like [Aricia agestis]